MERGRAMGDPSVISAYIKRFREQPPSSESERKKIGCKEAFWWQLSDENHMTSCQATDPSTSTVIPKVPIDNFPDLSLSAISETLVSSCLSSFPPPMSQKQDSYNFISANHEEDDEHVDVSVSVLADRLIQKCERLLLGADNSTDRSQVTAATGSSGPEVSVSPSASLDSEKSWSSDASHEQATALSFSGALSSVLNRSASPLLPSRPTVGHVTEPTGRLHSTTTSDRGSDLDGSGGSDCDSVTNSSMFFALSPSTSCISSAGAPNNPSPQLNFTSLHPRTTSQTHNIYSEPVPRATLSSYAYADVRNVDLAGKRSAVDDALVGTYLNTDPVVAELWGRLLSVRSEAAQILQVLNWADAD